ncbi:HET domain-containing protein [Colletotrichum tofieldiae]|uniref:HET domain-containing protein n=1 Tax=Colletotrichum tofieldiae TaxID=708197 RepID=A0A166UY61_9PEZI|nr:HET domain-containing protein [Colletotrichum tofieldiae]
MANSNRIPRSRYTIGRFKLGGAEPSRLPVTTALPEVVLDAMQLCRDINERYLWVDCLCIMEDNEEVKMLQINGMNAIYQLAEFTIVAAADGIGVGLPGASTRPCIISHKNECLEFISNLVMRVEYQSMDLPGEAAIAAACLLWIRARLFQLLP